MYSVSEYYLFYNTYRGKKLTAGAVNYSPAATGFENHKKFMYYKSTSCGI